MLKIEFLYYNKTSRSRCCSTDKAVRQSLKELKSAISTTGLKIDFSERKLPLSTVHLSPSILINGVDMEKIVNKDSSLKSNACTDCCRLAGHPVNCRTFAYKGKSYDYIPKAMIMEAIRICSKTQ